jgi:hypothetical protein
MEFLVFLGFIATYLQQSFDDKQLYKWKDVSSLSLGIGSAVVAALVKQLL